MKIEPQIHYLFISCRKFALNNRKKINNVFGGILTLIALFSALPLFSDKWRVIFLDYCSKVWNGLPLFISFFYDPKAFILYIISILVYIKLIYYKHEVRFLELALKNKRELAEELIKIKAACPNNHYLGLILGKLNTQALEVKNRRGSDIISSIDKNIKKYERVYWVSENEIGIIFYEIDTKDETDFVTYVIKNKLKAEIGEEDALLFLNNITFTMVKIDKADELFAIESKARTKFLINNSHEALKVNVVMPIKLAKGTKPTPKTSKKKT